MTDIVERLRDGIPMQSCDVRSDVWVRCGRGDCACERQLMISAAIEIARLRAALVPFAQYAELNDLRQRRPNDTIEVPVRDLLAAELALASGQGTK